jgi:hypothetical protein
LTPTRGTLDRLGAAEYAELVARVRATITASLPAGAAVLVLSKGDPTLVEVPGFAAAHFPQDAAGSYAGHHPRDSEDAVAQLEQLRRRGAEYLVVPATAMWWLDYYEAFAEHLASASGIVADVEGTCLIFDLGRRTAEALATPAEATPESSIAQMRDYLENLLPTETRVAVLETGDGAAAELAPVNATGLPAEQLQYGGDGPLGTLRSIARAGADYLVVPRSADEWLERHADVSMEIEASCRKVADQRHLCRVFELNSAWGDA